MTLEQSTDILRKMRAQGIEPLERRLELLEKMPGAPKRIKGPIGPQDNSKPPAMKDCI